MPGMVLGTIGYMAPEQVRGLTADHRSDIFAFGAMLYEMLSGRRAFRGDTSIDTMTAILQGDPPDLPLAERHIPPALERIVDRCLEKNPASRFKSADDLAFALEALSGQPSDATTAVARCGACQESPVAPLAGGRCSSAGRRGQLAVRGRPSPRACAGRSPVSLRHARTRKSQRSQAPLQPFLPTAGASPSWRSWTVRTQLWIRPLIRRRPSRCRAPTLRIIRSGRRTAGSLGSLRAEDSGRSTRQVDRLRRLQMHRRLGGTWNRDGVIIFAPSNLGPLLRVSSSGGAATPLMAVDTSGGEINHRYPSFLPDGRHFLFFVAGGEDKQGIYLGSLETMDRQLLLRGNSSGIYAPPGYLLFVREQTLMAQRFDDQNLELAGEAFPIADPVGFYQPNGGTFSASDNGVLAYARGDGAAGSSPGSIAPEGSPSESAPPMHSF